MMAADLPKRKPMPASYAPPPQATYNSHSRTRTTSSNIFPVAPAPQQQQQQASLSHPQSNMQIHSRRTPSQGTFSTTASSGNAPFPFRGNASSDLHRSGSSRSNSQQPTGYVALMRKQKATVWCDRAQHEDPRLLAQQKAAKMRAAIEIIGGNRFSTSGHSSLAGSNRVTAKIRHGGKAGLVGYSPGDLLGNTGVPMRLSASEVEGGDSDDDTESTRHAYHRRTGSGQSSLGSGRRGLAYRRQSSSSITHSPSSDPAETPVPTTYQKSGDYFAAPNATGDGTQSVGSGSSGERLDGVPEMDDNATARLASNSVLQSTVTREKSVRNPEELRRRGSIDDRTMTMSHVRGLYVANPDVDSD